MPEAKAPLMQSSSLLSSLLPPLDTTSGGFSGLNGVQILSLTSRFAHTSIVSSIVADALEQVALPSIVSEQLVSAAAGAISAQNALVGSIGANVIARQWGLLGLSAIQQAKLSSVSEPLLSTFRALQGPTDGSFRALVDAQAMASSWTATVLRHRVDLSDVLGSPLVDRRLGDLQRDFDSPSDAPPSGYGRLARAIETSGELREVVDDTMERAVRPGAFGFDIDGIRRGIDSIDQVLDRDPELAAQIGESLEETYESSQLQRYDLVDLSAALGLLDRVRAHQVSGTGIFLSFTAGLASFIVGAGVSADFNPVTSVVIGGTVYKWVVSRRDSRGKSTQAREAHDD